MRHESHHTLSLTAAASIRQEHIVRLARHRPHLISWKPVLQVAVECVGGHILHLIASLRQERLVKQHRLFNTKSQFQKPFVALLACCDRSPEVLSSGVEGRRD